MSTIFFVANLKTKNLWQIIRTKNPSMKQLDILKTENEIERSHYPILLQAQKAWENIEHFRQKRKRNRDYTYGKQWNDLIKLPDGRVVSEEQYIREQGKSSSEKQPDPPNGQSRFRTIQKQPNPTRMYSSRQAGTEFGGTDEHSRPIRLPA